MPVLGTCLILVRQPQSRWKQKFLKQPAMVLIGKISYGVYLWHWPLLVLMHLSDQTSSLVKIIALISSFVLAYVTYRLVEIPVRSIAVTRSSAIKFLAFGACATLLVGVTGVLFATGVIHRSWDATLIHAQYAEPVTGCAADARPDQTIDYVALQQCEKSSIQVAPL